jgi:cell shape-determining protein MreC
MMLVIVAAVALSGCATSGFLGFLATTQYVDTKAKAVQDQQAAEAKAVRDQQAAEIAALKAQLADYQSVKDQAKAAVDQANESRKTLEDLEARIASLPKDVIRQIADILQGSAAH